MRMVRERGWSLACLVVMSFLAFGSSGDDSSSATSYDSSSSSSSSSSTYSSVKERGYEGVLTIGTDDLVLVASSEESFKKLTNAVIAKDTEGAALMSLSGEIFSVPSGTKARLIDRNWTGGIQVRILEGEHYAESGWVPMEWLK